MADKESDKERLERLNKRRIAEEIHHAQTVLYRCLMRAFDEQNIDRSNIHVGWQPEVEYGKLRALGMVCVFGDTPRHIAVLVSTHVLDREAFLQQSIGDALQRALQEEQHTHSNGPTLSNGHV